MEARLLMHAVIYGRLNPVAYKILGFEIRGGQLGFAIESGGCLPQKAWVRIVKGLRVKPIAVLDPALFLPLRERKGGHNRGFVQNRKRRKDRIYHCPMCGEAKLLGWHLCLGREIAEPEVTG